MKNTRFIVFVILFLFLGSFIHAQIDPNLKRYIRIGELQSYFSSYGAERAWNNVYYEGLSWPSQYPYQDNAVIERFWIACKDFTDNNSMNYPYYGIYFSKGYVDISLFPMELKQIARVPLPDVYVNGIKRQTGEEEQVDEYDPNLPADRVVINVVNTSMGLTMTRKIYAFSHPNHDDYFIKKYTFQNTGNTDYDAEIERTETLKDIRIGKLPRYSTSREGAANSDNQQMWGKHSWVSKRGENYAEHANDIIADDYSITDWIRCGFSWMGQSELYSYDMIGAPIINDFEYTRLSAPQFAGVAVLHVDKSTADREDDSQQPTILGWHAGDTYPYVGNLNPSDSLSMHQLWDFLAGTPYSAASRGGSDRMDESNLASITDRVDPYTVHGDGGGTGIWIGYGHFDLAHGESVTIVEVDGVNGLSREKCLEIGENWLKAYENPSQEYSFKLPDGSTVTGKYSDGVGNATDIYKNSWFYTGIDSLLLTFSRAKRNYDSGFAISDALPPPMTFEILSDTNSIRLIWDNSAESYPDFAGYRICRKAERAENTFKLVFECGQDTDNPTVVHGYIDRTVENGIEYLYSITAFDNGNSNNGRQIESNIHLTMMNTWVQTGEPVILQDVYVSPAGNDSNDGLTLETPFKTIHHAIQKIQSNEINQLTIYLAEGEYSPSATGEQFPIEAKSFLTIKGAGKMKTLLNAESTNVVIQCNDIENFSLVDFSIINGRAIHGGGIYAAESEIKIAGVQITKNRSNSHGGGIYNFFSEIEFDQTNRCDVFNNYAVNPGGDIYRSNFTDESIVYLDTFTVQTASPYQIYPPIIQIDFINTKEEQIDADLFVSPTGNDNNSGLTTDQPLKSFRSAMMKIYADSTHQHTIYLNPGVFSATDSDYSNMVFCRDFVSLKGQPDQITTLDSISLRCDFIKNVSISDLVITNSKYSGIDGYEADFNVSNTWIADNGNSGIYLRNSSVRIEDCMVERNSIGGINISNTNLTVKGSTIRQNYGKGIHVSNNSIIELDSVDRNNVYLNGSGNFLGGDLYFVNQGPHHVCLDTFTYLYPIPESVYPLNNFTFDIWAAMLPQINGNAYVSPHGDDANNGTGWGTPLKTINRALELIYANDENPRTIFLDAGVYSSSTNDERFPIMIRDFVSIRGTSPDVTIIDAEKAKRVAECINVQGVELSNLRLRGGRSDNGGAIYVNNSTLSLSHVIFQDDSAKYGAGIYAENYSFLDLNQVAFVENQSKYGNAIYADNSNVVLKNATIANNTGSVSLYCNNYSPLKMINSIIWDEVSYEIVCRGATGEVLIAYSDLMNGESGVRENDYILDYQESNISEDPKFIGGSPFNYTLAAESPCIDAGTSLFEIGGDTLLYIPDDQYSGTAPDIGAYQIISYSGISEITKIPNNFRLYPNYPNPFNPSTTIAYDLPEASKVKITIYNVLGREVRTLFDGSQLAGHYSIRWNGRNEQDNPVAAGIYFIRCIAGDKIQDHKMLLLK